MLACFFSYELDQVGAHKNPPSSYTRTRNLTRARLAEQTVGAELQEPGCLEESHGVAHKFTARIPGLAS